VEEPPKSIFTLLPLTHASKAIRQTAFGSLPGCFPYLLLGCDWSDIFCYRFKMR